jgi:hypothetical protein
MFAFVTGAPVAAVSHPAGQQLSVWRSTVQGGVVAAVIILVFVINFLAARLWYKARNERASR